MKAVLFDLDGTLIDSAPGLGFAADLMRCKRGLPSLPLACYRPLAGAGARGMLSIALGRTTLSPDFEELKEEFFTTYEACILSHCQLFPGIANMVKGLEDQHLMWGIVTNKSKRFTLPIVDSIALFANVQTVVSGDTTAHAKPHPEPLFEAARQLGVLPSDCIYVGDDKRDIDAAKAAGMPGYAAAWGYLGEHALNSWQADGVLTSPVDLLAVCARLSQ